MYLRKIIFITLIGILGAFMQACKDDEEVTTHEITFDSGGGSEVESVGDVKTGTEITLPIPEKADHVFRYWQVGDNYYDDQYVVDEDTDFVAVWDHYETVFSYEIITDSDYYEDESYVRITEYNGLGRHVIIPTFMSGYPVTQLASESFKNSDILSISLPNSLQSVAGFAFFNAEALQTVQFHGEVYGYHKAVLGNSFYDEIIDNNSEVCIQEDDLNNEQGWQFSEGCPIHRVIDQSTPLILPDGSEHYTYDVVYDLRYYEDARNMRISDFAFEQADAITHFEIPTHVGNLNQFLLMLSTLSHLTHIDASNNEAFSTVDGVLYNAEQTTLYFYPSGLENTEYTLLDTTETIYSIAFMNAVHIETLNISSSIDDLPPIFSYMESLINIYVDEDHSVLTSVDGVLFEKGDDNDFTLHTYPAGRDSESYVVPSQTTIIGKYAFAYSQLTTITIPEGVTMIGEMAFYDSNALTDIVLPETLEFIGSYAFRDTALESIVIPSSVWAMDYNIFDGSPIKEIVLMRKLVEATEVSWANAFMWISSDTVIYVPDAHLENYQTLSDEINIQRAGFEDLLKPISERE